MQSRKGGPVPVPPKEWYKSSLGAWFTMVPVKRRLEQAPSSVSPEADGEVASMDTDDGPVPKDPTPLNPADIEKPTDDAVPPAICSSATCGASSEPCDGKASDAGGRMVIDWSMVQDICEQDLVPLPEVRSLYS